MSPITRRQAITASAAGSVAVLAIASDAVIQAKSTSPDAPKADTLQVLTPDQIVEGKVEGPVRVEFVVESLFRYSGLSTESEWPLNFKLKGVKATNEEFNVEVRNSVFRRLRELGIEDSPEESRKHGDVAVHRHFVGKKVRVNGTIKLYPKDGGRALYWLRIDNLDQIESVRRE
jgi:hypothetical protein